MQARVSTESICPFAIDWCRVKGDHDHLVRVRHARPTALTDQAALAGLGPLEEIPKARPEAPHPPRSVQEVEARPVDPITSFPTDLRTGDTPASVAARMAQSHGRVYASGVVSSAKLLSRLAAPLPERCPACERIHVRRDGCGSVPRDLEVITPVDADLAGPEAIPDGVAACRAESSVGAICSSEPGHDGPHRGLLGQAMVEWS